MASNAYTDMKSFEVILNYVPKLTQINFKPHRYLLRVTYVAFFEKPRPKNLSLSINYYVPLVSKKQSSKKYDTRM